MEKRIARFIEPFRVDPGSSVKLAKSEMDSEACARVSRRGGEASIGRSASRRAPRPSNQRWAPRLERMLAAFPSRVDLLRESWTRRRRLGNPYRGAAVAVTPK